MIPMKRLLVLLALTLPLATYGQDLSDIFEGKVVDKDEMVETYLMGSRLEPYHLNEFHSVKFYASEGETQQVIAAVLEDVDLAFERETVYAGGKLVYAILVYPETLTVTGKKKTVSGSRFVCYQLTESDGARAMVTLVEMKGTARLEDLKAIFAPADEDND